MNTNESEIREVLSDVWKKIGPPDVIKKLLSQKKMSFNSIEEYRIASDYIELKTAIEDIKNKSKKLESAKKEITKERYDSLENDYNDLLKRLKPIFKEQETLILLKIKEKSKRLNEVNEKLKKIDILIEQEKKLYDVGAISEKEYEQKTGPLKQEKNNLCIRKDRKEIKLNILVSGKNGELDVPPGTYEKLKKYSKKKKNVKNISIKTKKPNYFKNPSLATLLSFLAAGLGQMYNGEFSKGILFIAIYIISLFLMLLLIGWVTTPIIVIWSMYDAYSSAEKINFNIAGRTQKI